MVLVVGRGVRVWVTKLDLMLRASSDICFYLHIILCRKQVRLILDLSYPIITFSFAFCEKYALLGTKNEELWVLRARVLPATQYHDSPRMRQGYV